MGNKIRIKQIDLQGIFSASNQVNILSASNYAQFVTQLDTTMSSDAELSAVSSSISQSIYTINQVIGSGLVSGSSQLTSSYDTRYILSGSITQTTWDNVSNKPAGLVSESTDLSSLNQFTQSIDSRVDNLENLTGSYATTGSNTFKKNQTISGSLTVFIPQGVSYGQNENPTPSNVFWSYPTQDVNTENVEIGWIASVRDGGTYIVTDVQKDTPYAPFISITLSDNSLELGYRVFIDFTQDSKLFKLNSNGLVFPDETIQTTAYIGIDTGSFATTSSVDELVQLTNTFATTGSNEFGGYQRIDGYITASSFIGYGRNLNNLSSTTNWNSNEEFRIRETEQLTFSGDYILEDTYLVIDGSEDEVEYSQNKSFKKEGTIFIGGNLLVKDSYIINNGTISVGGEVILIGNSQIVGNGVII